MTSKSTKKAGNSKWGKWLPLCSVLLFFAFPALFLYTSNIKEINFSSVALPLFGFLATGGVLFCLVYWAVRDAAKAAFVSLAIGSFLLNYKYVEIVMQKVFSSLRYWHLVPIGLIAAVTIASLLWKVLSPDIRKDIPGIISLVFGCLILLNLAMAVPTGIQKITTVKSEKVQNTLQQTVSTSKQNVYWILADEYASFHQLNEFYHYDNSAFKNFLQERNFMISEDAHNDCAGTAVVLANCISLDFLATPDSTLEELKQYSVDPILWKTLENGGYTVMGVGDTEEWGLNSDTNSGKRAVVGTVDGKDYKTILLEKTVLSPFARVDYSKSRQNTMNVYQYMQTQQFSPNQARFMFTYIDSPHQPFLFDSNGGVVAKENENNWNDDKYYLEQLQYVTKNLESMVDHIIENDPGAVIILSSDHGARYQNVETPEEEKTRILHAVYDGGKPFESVRDKALVYTLRTILEDNLGMKIPAMKGEMA